MKKKLFIIFALCFIMASPARSLAAQERAGEVPYKRIVSLLPSTTETLFALGVGEYVVGVTRYCRYPPEALTKKVVGGIMDLNLEALYSLNPDLVIALEGDDTNIENIRKMGIKFVSVETRSVEGIISSTRYLGNLLNRQSQAQAIIDNINDKMDSIQARTKGLPKPKVLVSYLRPIGEGVIKDIYIAGNKTYFNDLLKIVGAENAYQGPRSITSPLISPEGILQMDPDIILDLMTMIHETDFTDEDVLRDWDMLPDLKAYRNKRIYVLSLPYIGIPGPRIVKALDVLVKIVHPEVDWDAP